MLTHNPMHTHPPTHIQTHTHMHAHTHSHTLAQLGFHSGLLPQSAAGKTSANYGPGAAFAAQFSMMFDTICLEFVKFQLSFIVVFVIIPFVAPAFHKYLHTDTQKQSLLTLCYRKYYFQTIP